MRQFPEVGHAVAVRVGGLHLSAGRGRGGHPVDRVIAIGGGIEALKRRAGPIRRGRPGRAIVVADDIDIDVAHAIRVGDIRAAQFETLAAVLQAARERPEHRHVRRHVVLGPERGGIRRHDEQQPVRRQGHIGGEDEIQAGDAPGVGGPERIEQRQGVAIDALQFHELIASGGGMVMDFIQHDRADERAGVRAGERGG